MNILKIILIVLCVLTVILVLLQSNKQDAGLGALTGQSDSNLFTEKKDQGTDLLLLRLTSICAFGIIFITLLINVYK